LGEKNPQFACPVTRPYCDQDVCFLRRSRTRL
jgi:hypothetical protein